MAETKAQKAVRLLTERRLIIERVYAGVIVASCRGDSGEVYQLGFDPRNGGQWRCQCEASAKFRRTCAHILSLQMVCVKPRQGTAERRGEPAGTSGGA